MEYIYTIILAVVQGIAEFAPISSSGHLVLLHEVVNLELTSELAFDVALHAGTLLAIIIFFSKDIIHYLRTAPRVFGLLLISSIPAALVGLLFEDVIDAYLRAPIVVVVMLVLIALVFLWVERKAKQSMQLTELSYKQALLIGVSQIVALIPGTSRSGVTISTGLLLGLTRSDAARFSFLMAVPVIGGATLKKVYDVWQVGIPSSELQLTIIGVIISCITGIVVIKFLLEFFKRYSLRPFAWYRIVLAAVVIITIIL